MGWPWETEGKVHEAGRSPTVGSPGGVLVFSGLRANPPTKKKKKSGILQHISFLTFVEISSQGPTTVGDRSLVPGNPTNVR